MKYVEIKGDLFTAPQGFYLAHCISSDFALGAGIAKKFDEVYDMRFKLHKRFPNKRFGYVDKALLIDNVFNLVTKYKCYHKPTYYSLQRTLFDMKEQCIALDITKLAMPKIGSGLDKLEWGEVKSLIYEVFEDTNIFIVIYIL